MYIAYMTDMKDAAMKGSTTVNTRQYIFLYTHTYTSFYIHIHIYD